MPRLLPSIVEAKVINGILEKKKNNNNNNNKHYRQIFAALGTI